ncbi:MAG: 4-hydroxy-tetrahydrodipicolinate reductase [Chlorobi bacterium]|nr:4-hydroxy-tetrahydrodipicolinate reductase [Chlorobiota bacterium]
MKIALIGYGKMGKVIEEIALYRKHKVVLKIDINNTNEKAFEKLKNTDVAFEFTRPESAVSNILKCFEYNTPVVCGTTGWLDKWDLVKKECERKRGTFFYASNYSIGVNILFEMNKIMASIMDKYNNYDVELTEIHHLQKLDSPSGTAITLANDILEKIERKTRWVNNKTAGNSEINIISKREDKIPGTHTIKYISNVDKLEISHVAKNRQGFGLGAVVAAEYCKDKKGIFNMQDLLKF